MIFPMIGFDVFTYYDVYFSFFFFSFFFFFAPAARGWVASVRLFLLCFLFSFFFFFLPYSRAMIGRVSVQCLDDQLSGLMFALNRKLGSDCGMWFPAFAYGPVVYGL